jgi:hypothetical protein
MRVCILTVQMYLERADSLHKTYTFRSSRPKQLPVAVISSDINPGKTDTDLNYTCRYSSYRTLNALRLGYKNQTVYVVYRNNRSLFCDPHKTHKYSVGRT